MAKICSCGKCNLPVFSKGLSQPCWKRKYSKPLPKSTKPLKRTPLKKSNKPIKKQSKKLAADLRKYYPLRDQFLVDNPVCQLSLPGCTKVSTEVHHAKGRGKYLLTVETFKAGCSSCHRYITDNSKEAIKTGLSMRRNTPLRTNCDTT